MALAIRLSRGGRKSRPFYRIVVADKRMPRDGRYIEKLGTYNPLLDDQNEERVKLVEERIKYWLSQGAKPSERVAIFLGKAGLIDMPEQPNRPNKSAPGEKAKALIEEKEEIDDEASKSGEIRYVMARKIKTPIAGFKWWDCLSPDFHFRAIKFEDGITLSAHEPHHHTA